MVVKVPRRVVLIVNTYWYCLSNKSIKAAASDQALLSYPQHGKIYIYMFT